MHIRRLVGVLFLIALLGLAQVATSRFEGTVQDESGAVIPGAKVTAVNIKTQARSETTASAEGMFIFPSLQPGVYTISVEAAGFRKAVVNDLELNAALTVSQRIKLEIGQVTESVVVEANAVRSWGATPLSWRPSNPASRLMRATRPSRASTGCVKAATTPGSTAST
jgi:hypothetical protein